MSKEYLEEQYAIAVLDYKTADTEDKQWDARKQIAKLEELVILMYGNDFWRMLREKYLSA